MLAENSTFLQDMDNIMSACRAACQQADRHFLPCDSATRGYIARNVLNGKGKSCVFPTAIQCAGQV